MPFPAGGLFDFTAKGYSHAPDFATSHRWWLEAGKTTPEDIDQWAHQQLDPYFKAGFQPQDLAMFAMSDEPGWCYPMMLKPLSESPLGLPHFRDYLKSQGLTPQDVGAAKWDVVLPVGQSKAVDLPSRRLYYWTIRFFSWASARHYAACASALERASYPGMPIYTNWSPSAQARIYYPGASGHNPDTASADAGNGSHDWLEFGRLRGGTMLWTEDWFHDDMAYQWSFYSALLRCGAEKGGATFGGYIVPVAGGDYPGGIVQKALTLIGSGAKGLQWYMFGPEYMFPGNCYSEKSAKVLPQMAEAARMIGKAEDLLWPGRRPRPQVAILAPRSSEVWDTHKIEVAITSNMNVDAMDYTAEAFDLYVALQHADIPADFVEEDDLSANALAPYKVLYVTEPDIPAEGQKGVVEWVRKGGTVVTVTGAAAGDRYDQPCAILAGELGTSERPRERLFIANPGDLKESGKGHGTLGSFTAFGPRGTLLSTPKEGILASFDDGAPAVVERRVGDGRVVHFTWMPGLSYSKSATRTNGKLPTGFSPDIRGMITHPVQAARATAPVTVDLAMIETPLLLSAKGAAVTLLNWSGQEQKKVRITVRVPFPVRSVESVKCGQLTFSQAEGGITCALPLGAADIVLLRP